MFRTWLHDTLASLHPGHPFDVMVPPDAAMGDYSVNLAFGLAKHQKRNPRDVAAELCEFLAAADTDRIARCEVAGPGFVNIVLSDDWLRRQLHQNDIPQEGHSRKVIVEYGSLNAAKVPHIGHSRSVIIGDALARVHAALGYGVIRWDYPGDWGVQYGQIIARFKEDGTPVLTVADMEKLYVRFHEAVAADASWAARGSAEFKKLEEGDAENRALWERFSRMALAEHAGTYARLGVAFDVRKGESAYEEVLPLTIEQLLAHGLARESDGALVVNLEEFSLPVGLIRKSDGGTLYLTRDIASLDDRIRSYAPAKVLYVVANQQALHLEQLFATEELLKRAGAVPGDLPELVHVKYGLVLGPDGKKFSTREGNVVGLDDVLAEAIRRAKAVVLSKNPDLSGERADSIAEAVGIGALKYNDLRQHPHTDIIFDWDTMLDLGGNSGPYLQYTAARLAGIAAKAGERGTPDRSALVHPDERALMRHLLEYGWTVSQCAKLRALNGLALYLYELAVMSNRYYEHVRINDDDNAARKAARLELIGEVERVLREGLGLMGIRAPERI
jgi:arginyl-tRNA synthetase